MISVFSVCVKAIPVSCTGFAFAAGHKKLPHRWGALRKEVSVFEGKCSEMLRRQSLTVGRLPAACGFAFQRIYTSKTARHPQSRRFFVRTRHKKWARLTPCSFF